MDSAEPQASGGAPLPRAGLRLQIVVALAVLMLLAFVPLFFAVASLTRATILATREQAARAIARAVAADAAERADPATLEPILAKHVGVDGVESLCAFRRTGDRVACAGPAAATVGIAFPALDGVGTARLLHGSAEHILEANAESGPLVVVTHVDAEGSGDRGTALVRLVALYMSVFALALLVFAYFSLTRLIVQPVDRLVSAANRVAGGARTLQVPKSGARELAELSASMQAMAEKLISEESALLQKVAELTETTTQLTETQTQLVRSERMASVGRLAAGLAHEIGNPIAALMGLQDLVLGGGLTAHEERDFIRRMRSETERIHTVVRDLLDFARPEEPGAVGGKPAPPAAVSAVLEDVAALVRPQRLLRSVDLTVEVENALAVALPAPRLTQVLLNMVLNAASAIESTRRPSGRITVRAFAAPNDRARIEVEDDGPGIAPAVRDRLFEPFVTTKPVGKGTGLGLAVCRGLVESAGGQIGVDASYTGGARFFVVLPCAGG